MPYQYQPGRDKKCEYCGEIFYHTHTDDEKCHKCKGDGFYADHAPMSTHNPEDGSCLQCPVQVPCEDCNGTGKLLYKFTCLQKQKGV